jgi:nitrogen fixation NifU-like protein
LNDLYREVLLAEARQPKNQGVLSNFDLETTQVNASCGDSVHVMIQLDAARERILDIKWQGNGCIISQASLSVMTEAVKGKTLAEVRSFTTEQVLEELGLETISPGRLKCLSLGLSAIQSLLQPVVE